MMVLWDEPAALEAVHLYSALSLGWKLVMFRDDWWMPSVIVMWLPLCVCVCVCE